MMMHSLGHAFIQPSVHAGGLRYHGSAPLVSHLLAVGVIEAEAYHQRDVFESAVQFARCEVISFMKAMAAASPQIHLTSYGYTFEGRPMPLAVIGAPDATPESVRATAKTRIYIQGNIHAGEVEGKEAALWLLRSIAKGERAAWLQNVVLLINPIYNADGNERVSLRNRGSHYGPIGGMGQRANAQDLDLNRDNTKMETSEAWSLARMMTQYDPHILVDLHTTNGSDHGFFVTYETSDSPNTSPGIADLVRKDLFPWVTKTVKAKHGWNFFYYGGVSRQGERAWRGDHDLYKLRQRQRTDGDDAAPRVHRTDRNEYGPAGVRDSCGARGAACASHSGSGCDGTNRRRSRAICCDGAGAISFTRRDGRAALGPRRPRAGAAAWARRAVHARARGQSGDTHDRRGD